MRKRRLILLLIGVVLLAVGLAVLVRPEREPEYGGKRLSEWVEMFTSNRSSGGDRAAEEAIRHIGTNSLPYLLRWISYEPAAWRIRLYEALGKFLGGPNRLGPSGIFQDKKMLLAVGAARAFGGLGSEANAATGEVRRVLVDPKRGLSRAYAVIALHSHQNPMSSGQARISNLSVCSGADTFSMIFPTNGVPIVTVSHSNARPALPGLPSRKAVK